MNADGTQQTNLTSTLDGYSSDPRWSPDGSRILFLNGRDLYVMDANGGNLLRLTDDPTVQVNNPDWAPDNRRIVFQQFDQVDSGDLWIIKVDGSKRWHLTDGPNWDHDPVWRP
jgi:Tol biopolymer transport system component